MTTLMPSKSTGAGRSKPPPAAGRPASIPPPARAVAASIPVDDDEAAESDDGRTQVRQPLNRVLVPKTPILTGGDAHPADEADPTRAYVHPADHRDPTGKMPGAGMLHNSTPPPPGNAGGRIPTRSLTVEDGPSADAPAYSMTPAVVQQPRSVPPPAALASTRPQMMDRMGGHPMQSNRPPPFSQPPPPMVAHLSGGYPQQPMNMGAPAMSQPAHFAVPQMAPSEGRIDPPATVLTQRTSGGASKTMSWAAALMAVGVFVGLVAAVVAGGGSDTLADTSASFVDPARPSQAKRSTPTEMPKLIVQPLGAMPNAQLAAQTTTQSNVFPQAGMTQPQMSPAVPPPLVNGGINTGIAPQPMGQDPNMAAPPPVAVAPPPQMVAPPPMVAAAPPPPQNDTPASAPPPRRAAPVAQPAPARRAAAPAQPKQPAASSDDDSVAAAPPPKKPPPAAASKGGKGGDDDELKKAADALSKAQLENSL
jgi:hypothetical protein